MIGWWIWGILILLLLLFLWMRLGVRVAFPPGGPVTADVTLGPFRIRAAPAKPGKAQEKRPEKPKKKRRPKKAAARLWKFPRPTAADLREAKAALLPPVKRALGRTRRSIRLDPLRLSLTIGGAADAAGAAERYGLAQAALWTAMPALEQLLTVPDPRIHIGLDFRRDGLTATGEAGISIRIGTLLGLGFSPGIPVLCWLMRYLKRKKGQAESAPDPEPPIDPADPAPSGPEPPIDPADPPRDSV